MRVSPQFIRTCTFILILLVIYGCKPKTLRTAAAQINAAEKKTGITIEVSSYKELEDFFKHYGYTFDAWQAGYRAIPRAYIAEVPNRWAEIADRISLENKRKLFYSALLPVILRANELILTDRRHAEPIAMRIFAKQSVTEEEFRFMKTVGDRYELVTSTTEMDAKWTRELLNRMDTIPPSLALAQAAYESAFATSRFAGLGNALFGQYSSDGDRMKPKEASNYENAYQIAAFESPLESVLAYADNLNTHPAYAQFRKLRAEFRREGKTPDSTVLAASLLRYSTRKESYTREIIRTIRSHDLTRADLAFLQSMEPVHIVPKPKIKA